MVQGIFGGGTSYEGQSLKDIFADIIKWEEYSSFQLSELEKKIKHLEDVNFWRNIPFNFQATVVSSCRCIETFIQDFQIIKNAFTSEFITKKEVNLLMKIGNKSADFNDEFGKTYKEDDYWKKYGDKDFQVVEEIYGETRDFFVTLQDASNAANRLEDYMEHNAVQNNLNVSGSGNNMNVQQGIHNNMRVSTNNQSELELLINGLLENLSNLVDSEKEEEVKEYLEVIKEETKKEIPRKQMLGFAVNSLKLIKGTAEFGAAVTGILQFIAPLLG